MLYIQKEIRFWNVEVQLPGSYLVSTDIEDYENGAYLLLNEEQERYHNDHPEATPLECWNMAPEPDPEPTPEELLWRARDAKRKEIYDKDIHHYYIDEQDAYVSNTLQVKDKCGRQEEVEVGGHLYASNILTVALDEIADYSEQCGKVTDSLLSRIDAAQTAEEVEAIVVQGYPEMIHTTTAALQTKADKAIAKSPEAQAVTFARAMMNSVPLTASQALEMQVLFPIWGEKDAEFGKEVGIGFRLRVVEGESDTLFEVIQKHKLQADWKPGVDTASLYKTVDVEHEGTLDDPIPYTPPMELYKDKYYTQGGVKYRCVRDSGQPMSHELSALIGLYVELVK
ncbi:hypothetical protein AAH029_01600 [Parabacteroides distasonis]|uniref:hypothetical protein n=1 Tax=Parabacteroides distasonis TaxID=823 RepID=UPI0039B53CF4